MNPRFPCVADAHKSQTSTVQRTIMLHTGARMRLVALGFVALFTWLHLLFKRSPATMDSAVVCQNVVEKWRVDSN